MLRENPSKDRDCELMNGLQEDDASDDLTPNLALAQDEGRYNNSEQRGANV